MTPRDRARAWLLQHGVIHNKHDDCREEKLIDLLADEFIAAQTEVVEAYEEAGREIRRKVMT